METRWFLTAHAQQRYRERVLGIATPDISRVGADEMDQIRRNMYRDLNTARTVDGISRALFTHLHRRPDRGKLGFSDDTEYLIIENCVYFIRKGSNTVLTVIVLEYNLHETFLQLEKQQKETDAKKTSNSQTPFGTIRQQKRQPSDIRDRENIPSAIVDVDPNLEMYFNYVYKWTPEKTIQELEFLVTESCLCIGRRKLDQFVYHTLQNGLAYFLHPQHTLLFGVTYPTSRIRLIKTAKKISSEECNNVLLERPSILNATARSVIECSPRILRHIQKTLHVDVWNAYTFLIQQFRNASTRLCSLDEEPSPNKDLVGQFIVCYLAPSCYLFMEDYRVLDIVFLDEAVFDTNQQIAL